MSTTTSTEETTAPQATPKKVISGISQELITTLNDEINLMLAFAAHNGLIINTNVNQLLQSDSVDDLINAHNMLCKNVAPATPKSINYTNHIKINDKKKSLFNQIPLVRNLILLAVVFLISFVLFGLSPMVNDKSLDQGVLANNGLSLLYNLGFLASISGLGVLFNLLKTVSSSVINSTLIPEETVNYVSQIILGIISGLLLSEVIMFYTDNPSDINLFNKSVLALIGGFSSDAIFTVLQGLIERLKSIFTPSQG
jgi:hypothetical protein